MNVLEICMSLGSHSSRVFSRDSLGFMGFWRNLARFPAKFGTGRQVYRVYSSHKNTTFLTFRTNIVFNFWYLCVIIFYLSYLVVSSIHKLLFSFPFLDGLKILFYTLHRTPRPLNVFKCPCFWFFKKLDL